MSKLIPTDRAGQVSRTLLFILVGAGAIVWKFLEPGSTVDVMTFAQAYTLLLAPWIVRETKESYFKGKDNVQSN